MAEEKAVLRPYTEALKEIEGVLASGLHICLLQSSTSGLTRAAGEYEKATKESVQQFTDYWDKFKARFGQEPSVGKRQAEIYASLSQLFSGAATPYGLVKNYPHLWTSTTALYRIKNKWEFGKVEDDKKGKRFIYKKTGQLIKPSAAPKPRKRRR